MAILDTGIDETDEGIQKAFMTGAITQANCRGFPDDDEFHPLRDKVGHGTHSACLLIKTAPDAVLYIARMVDNSGQVHPIDNYDNIVQASARQNSADLRRSGGLLIIK